MVILSAHTGNHVGQYPCRGVQVFKGLPLDGTFERSSEALARVVFCRSLREVGTASELSGMVTAHFEWSICFCTPRYQIVQSMSILCQTRQATNQRHHAMSSDSAATCDASWM